MPSGGVRTFEAAVPKLPRSVGAVVPRNIAGNRDLKRFTGDIQEGGIIGQARITGSEWLGWKAYCGQSCAQRARIAVRLAGFIPEAR